MMPEIPDVVPGEFIFDTWGNPVARRTVQRYADVPTRDTQNPTPQTGDMAYVIDLAETQQYVGVQWIPTGARTRGPRIAINPGSGFWWRPSEVDNLQDWRFIENAGTLIIQNRKTGGFVTVAYLDLNGNMISTAPVAGFPGFFRNIHWGTTPPDSGLGLNDDVYLESPGAGSPTKVYIKNSDVWRGA